MLAGMLMASAMALPRLPQFDPLSCGPANPQVTLPAAGAEGIATNARIWLSRHDYDLYEESGPEWVIVGPGGTEVEYESTTIDLDLGHLQLLTPTQPFEPNTHYQLWSCEQTECSTIATEFTTGEEDDATPPPLPVETDRQSANHRSERFVELGVDFEGVLVVDLGQADLRPETLEGSVHLAAMDDTELLFGEGRCVDNWPGERSDDNVIRYGSFDIAGNFSGWTEPEPISLSGCRLSEHGEGSLAFVVLLLLGSMGKRRRSAS